MIGERRNKDSDQDAQTDALALAEETATVSKRVASSERVEVKIATETTEEAVREILHSDHVEVTRVAINRQVDTVPKIRNEGDLTIVPILEEVLIVEKRLMLKEELHIRRTANSEQFESTVTLRRQRAVVEHLNNAGNQEPRGSSADVRPDTEKDQA